MKLNVSLRLSGISNSVFSPFFFTDIKFHLLHHTFTALLQAMVSNIACCKSTSFFLSHHTLLRECTSQWYYVWPYRLHCSFILLEILNWQPVETDHLCFFIQSLVQNSRKAGITSALTSSTLHNEELVGSFPIKYDIVSCFASKITTTHSSPLLYPCRSLTCTRRPSRHSYTLFHAQPHTISRCGQPQRPLTAMSVRDFCGVLLVRACAVLSVVSNAMRSAKIYSMLTVFRVSYP